MKTQERLQNKHGLNKQRNKSKKFQEWDLVFGWDSSHWIWKEWPKRFGYYYLKDAVAIQISDPDMPF